ncbi:MAG: tetratricopeptide repeat protein, partial [Anaerolineae bacterium]|nr:tetratricopeptide repeat protein [Anaerolineae bacterium]
LGAAEETINADPYSSDAWAIRSMVLTWDDQPELAIPSALRALELAGDDPANAKAQARAQAFLAEAYLNVGQYERALSTVERALEIDPDSFEALRVRSLIAQQYEYDFVAALDYSQSAHDLAPNLSYLTLDLVELEIREGNTDVAQAMLDEVIENNPNDTRALWWMGYVYLNVLGDPNEGADYFSRCVDADPESILCLYNLGRAQMRLEQYASALESFETTIRLGTTNARHYWWAGRAEVVQNGCPAATSYLRTGYDMAKVEGDEILIGDFEDQMRSCQLFVEPSFESTEEATAEATAEIDAP